ncbi:type VI secretion system tube protein Hcp [Jiulongibacter sediminis]|jgi:type VI secretion system Hcp family effector|nr:type VI secretion system tube protein Hcp [Jiulongibacter sediminis]
MIVYETDQKSLFLRREGSWEALSEPVPNNEPHIFVEFSGAPTIVPGDVENTGIHGSQSRVLHLDFNIFSTLGTGRSVGVAEYDFKFKKKLGKSSPLLNKALLRRESFTDVIFTFYIQTTKDDVPYYSYHLENVNLLSMRTVGPHSELTTLLDATNNLSAKSMIEEIQLVFEQITIKDHIHNTEVTHSFNTNE